MVYSKHGPRLLDCTTKISKKNLDHIAKLKVSGYEPNDYIINLALDKLEKTKRQLITSQVEKNKLSYTTKISKKTLQRILRLKISGYEPNDLVIGKALDELEKK